MPRRGWTPAARRINGRRLERNRKFVDSPLEGAVRSEPVLKAQNSLLAGKIQGISGII